MPAVYDPILVADDDAGSRELVARYLDSFRVANPVLAMPDGPAVIDYVEAVRAGSRSRPALGLLDLHMPGATGLEVLAHLAASPLAGSFPVVMLTGSSEVADLTRAYDLGAASYLIKPVGYDALGDVIRGLPSAWALVAS